MGAEKCCFAGDRGIDNIVALQKQTHVYSVNARPYKGTNQPFGQLNRFLLDELDVLKGKRQKASFKICASHEN